MVDDKMTQNIVILEDEDVQEYLEDEEYFEGEDDFNLLGEEFDDEYDEYYSDEEFEWNFPTRSEIPPTEQELADWAAFNYELSLTLIPDWERSRDWM